MAYRRAHVVVGLGFGDEGKGSIVDYLTRTKGAKLIVRFNGGAQAAHNVVTPDGTHHTFSQFGSGMLADPQVETLLSKYTAIHPAGIIREARALEAIGIPKPIERLIIDERALVITPYHQEMNRIREYARGAFKHGSCGIGVGETISDKDKEYSISVADLYSYNTLVDKLTKIRDSKSAIIETLKLPKEAQKAVSFFQDQAFVYYTADFLQSFGRSVRIYLGYRIPDVLNSVDDIIFEGAQGALLDESWGFYPYTTWSDCTANNALNLLKQEADWSGKITTYGVLRAYSTRHGVGPFPTEDYHLASRLPNTSESNITNEWQGKFRIGWFDGVLARYALKANADAVDTLVVTNLDRLRDMKQIKVCHSYVYRDVEISNIPPYYRAGVSFKDMQLLAEDLMHRTRPLYHTVKFDELIYNIEREAEHEIGMLSLGTTWEGKREVG
jgi:adenylosuccinate synthase